MRRKLADFLIRMLLGKKFHISRNPIRHKGDGTISERLLATGSDSDTLILPRAIIKDKYQPEE